MSDPRFIFSINSGRAGSQYLARLLNTAHRVRAFHETEPQMIGHYLRLINDLPYDATVAERRVKAEALRAYFDPQDPKTRIFWRKRLAPWTFPEVYADTSHMFIKTFSDVVMSEFANSNVDVVVLRRPLAQVLKSFIELSYFGTSAAWPDWMSSPNAATAAVRCIAPDDELDHFDRCIAYLIDIEARTERFRTQHPEARLHEVTLADLNSWTSVRDLFAGLEIHPTRQTTRVIGRPMNQKREMKARLGTSTTLEYCEERIAAYLESAGHRGIEMPELVNNRQFR